MPQNEKQAIRDEMVGIIGMGISIQDDRDEQIAMQAAAELEFDGIINSNENQNADA